MNKNKELEGDELKVIKALHRLKCRANQKTLSQETGFSQFILRTILASLSGKGYVEKDETQKPHIFWKLLIDIDDLNRSLFDGGN